MPSSQRSGKLEVHLLPSGLAGCDSVISSVFLHVHAPAQVKGPKEIVFCVREEVWSLSPC